MEIQAEVALAERCTLGVGGTARYFTVARSVQDVTEALSWARTRGVSVIPLGSGSNVVFHDESVPALVIELASRRLQHIGPGLLAVEAGYEWDDLVRYCVEHDLAGVECLSGIPGRVGAAPIQNIGAYGQEVSETIQWVEAVDVQEGKTRRFTATECRFRYRDSFFKSEAPNRYVVTRVCFALRERGAPTVKYPELSNALADAEAPTLRDVRERVRELRAAKSMLLDPEDPNTRSCGSFFVNPIVQEPHFDKLIADNPDMPHHPAAVGTRKLSGAWLIQNAGFERGERRGNVGLSTKHTLCVVAYEGATARAVADFAAEIRTRVEERFGVRLVPEPNFHGFDALEDRLPAR